MPITFQVRESLETKPLDLHFLPAKVNGDGKADVHNYFNSYTRTEQGGIIANAVRGFPLKGRIIEVPETHTGVVLQESQNSLNTDLTRNFYTTGYFAKFCYWNYDKVPSKADAYKQAVQIFKISEELSGDVSDIELIAEIERKRCKSGAKENNC
ncbi:PREDICTED: uncharacterized protein LOC108356133 isoform X1 [Rhagoletis zephyria]|uniref:uncharacterized protein LOC108356133 isoform X1 n=1 Tax=Rhagoletis zephyria TaxID=28612 RepID=UPI00081184FC|nr:PREDICTED: uncharacterized protein LOC108356133 isoform X1 [Rhagoletis zephyria]